MTLEDILKTYKFAKDNSKLFLKRPYKDCDDFTITMTKQGYKAYGELTSLLYEVARLTDTHSQVDDIIECLDRITSEEN